MFCTYFGHFTNCLHIFIQLSTVTFYLTQIPKSLLSEEDPLTVQNGERLTDVHITAAQKLIQNSSHIWMGCRVPYSARVIDSCQW